MKTVICVIPVYNNAGTIRDIIRRVKKQNCGLLVVDDGSTDMDLPLFCRENQVECIRHDTNRGKGAALRSAAGFLKNREYDCMLTLDGDGQHYPEDIPLFLSAVEQDNALIIGVRDFRDPHVPRKSRTGRRISNFWIRLETGLDIADSQSGFRAYPAACFRELNCTGNHYNYETEILLRAVWNGIPVKEIPIRSWYPEKGERISHFHPVLDTLRISLTHLSLLFQKLRIFPVKRQKQK